MSAVKTDLRSLYSDHHGWLLGWLRKKLKCPQHAADLAQDTFMRLLVGGELTGIREPRAFLTTTASRLIIDDARRRRVEAACLEAYAVIYPEAATVPPPEYWIDMTRALTAIDAMLDGLPEKPRRAFLMNRLDAMPYAEIAGVLGVSTSMIKQYIAKALVHCYRVLNETGAHV